MRFGGRHKSCESFESFRNQGTTGAVSSLGWPFCDAVQPHTWRSMQSNFCPPIELPAIAQWLSERMFAVSKCFGIQQKEQKRGLRPRTLSAKGLRSLEAFKGEGPRVKKFNQHFQALLECSIQANNQMRSQEVQLTSMQSLG